MEEGIPIYSYHDWQEDWRREERGERGNGEVDFEKVIYCKVKSTWRRNLVRYGTHNVVRAEPFKVQTKPNQTKRVVRKFLIVIPLSVWKMKSYSCQRYLLPPTGSSGFSVLFPGNGLGFFFFFSFSFYFYFCFSFFRRFFRCPWTMNNHQLQNFSFSSFLIKNTLGFII